MTSCRCPSSIECNHSSLKMLHCCPNNKHRPDGLRWHNNSHFKHCRKSTAVEKAILRRYFESHKFKLDFITIKMLAAAVACHPKVMPKSGRRWQIVSVSAHNRVCVCVLGAFVCGSNNVPHSLLASAMTHASPRSWIIIRRPHPHFASRRWHFSSRNARRMVLCQRNMPWPDDNKKTIAATVC